MDTGVRQSEIRFTRDDFRGRGIKVAEFTFKQTIHAGDRSEPLNYHVICNTKIKLFPMVAVSKTVYFVHKASLTDDGDDRSQTLIPVAYAIHPVHETSGEKR